MQCRWIWVNLTRLHQTIDVRCFRERPETGVAGVPEGGGPRPDLEKVPEMETQNVEKTLQ